MSAPAISTTAFQHVAAAPARIAGRAVAAVARFLTAWKNRNALYLLGACSDAELADMGITRGDLFDASGSRWHEDPTRQLTAMRRQRLITAEMAARRVC